MRTSEERVQALHRRMDAMKKAKRRRKYRLLSTAAYAACFAITLAVALVIKRLPIQNTGKITGGAVASIFAEHASLDDVVIALLAFCLGVLATIFCFRMKNHMKENQDHDRPD